MFKRLVEIDFFILGGFWGVDFFPLITIIEAALRALQHQRRRCLLSADLYRSSRVDVKGVTKDLHFGARLGGRNVLGNSILGSGCGRCCQKVHQTTMAQNGQNIHAIWSTSPYSQILVICEANLDQNARPFQLGHGNTTTLSARFQAH